MCIRALRDTQQLKAFHCYSNLQAYNTIARHSGSELSAGHHTGPGFKCPGQQRRGNVKFEHNATGGDPVLAGAHLTGVRGVEFVASHELYTWLTPIRTVPSM